MILNNAGVALIVSVTLCLVNAEPTMAHEGHLRKPVLAAKKPGLGISLARDAQGRIWQVSSADGHVWLRRAEGLGQPFGTAIQVNSIAETIAADGENRPKIALGPKGELYVSWTQSLPQPYTGHIRFARSLDGGTSFSPPITVNDDLAMTSHRFDSLIVDGAGRIHLVWLDKRDALAAKRAGQPYTGAALYHTVSADGGANFNANARLVPNTCECCRIALALDRDGMPLVMWRHVFMPNLRDHALLKLDGQAVPIRVSFENWAIEGCPHHGPALHVGPQGTRHLAWFTGAPGKEGLYYAHMTSTGGMSIPLRLGKETAGHAVFARAGKQLWLAWKDFATGRDVIRAQYSSDEGQSWSTPRTVAQAQGLTDYPLLMAEGERLSLIWNTDKVGLLMLPLKP